MTLTTAEGELIIFLLAAAALFLAGLWYLRKRFAARRLQLKGEIAESAARTEERAHNQIVLDEAELATLAREGFDLERPKSFLNDAQSAFDRKDFHHALQIAQSVHDSLVKMRRDGVAFPAGGPSGPGFVGTPLLAPPEGFAADGPTASSPDAPAPDASSRPALPKNQMESRFQIELLTEELVQAVRTRPNDPQVVEANRLAAEARTLEKATQYTEALRAALKARRTLGGKLETVSSTPGGTPASPPGGDPSNGNQGLPIDGTVPVGGRTRPGLAGSPPPSTSARECVRCHRPLRQGDVFCRSCGAPAVAPKCPRCGSPLEAEDRFCPRCGAPMG